MAKKNEYELEEPSFVLQNPENDYEMLNFSTNARRDDVQPTETIPRKKASEQTTWKRLLLVIAALQCLMVFLLLAILGLMLLQLYARDVISPNQTSTSTSTSTAGGIAGNIVFPNFTEWSDNIVIKVHRSLPDFDEWANHVVSKVNSNVTGSLPDFSEWANGVVSEVNSNVTGSLPDFNEWANGVSQNTLQLFQNNTNFTELDKQILQTTSNSAQRLINIVNTLSNLQDTSTSTAGVADDTLLFTKQTLMLLNNSRLVLPTSCKQIQNQIPTSPSGYYVLASDFGSTTYAAYCNMEELCGSGGGWTRLAYLDMSDATQNCPSGFRLYQSGGVRACGRISTHETGNFSAGCVSVQFPSNGISYSQLCGRVTGYQYGRTNAFNINRFINGPYVDGVSITRGSPRQHVWTLVAGFSESDNSTYSCPCNNGSSESVQSFIDNDYFCESGSPNKPSHHTFYTSDPLWDGQGCGSLESSCCNVTTGIPWFHRDYGSTTTTDYIELRVCANYIDENTPVSYYEIYVK